MKFIYYNNTDRIVNIHPATIAHGCKGEINPIRQHEERVFILPQNTYPSVKMWDYGEGGLSILISPVVEDKPVQIKDTEQNFPDDFWYQMLSAISDQISKASFDTWLKDTKGDLHEEELVISCPNEFTKDWIEEKYLPLIITIANEITQKEITITLRTEIEV